MYPILCLQYNNGGCDAENCRKIHLCRRLVIRGQCKVPQCELSHRLYSRDFESLRAFGLTPQTPNLMKDLRQHLMISYTLDESHSFLNYVTSILDAGMESSFFYDTFGTSEWNENRKSVSHYQSSMEMSLTIFRKVQRKNRDSVFSEEKSIKSVQSSQVRSSSGLGRKSGSRSKSPGKYLGDKTYEIKSVRAISSRKVGEALDLPAVRPRSVSPNIAAIRRSALNPNIAQKKKYWKICSNYLNNNCDLNTQCQYHHPKSRKIYHWIYKFDDEIEWLSLDAESENTLEAAFADPRTNEILKFCLHDSKGVKVDVRVLFANYVFAESVSGQNRDAWLYRLGLNHRDERNWVWYWLRETKPLDWVPYGMRIDGVKSSIKYADIEAVYRKLKNDSTEGIKFDVGSKLGYVLHISKSSMYDGFPFSQESPNGSIRRVCRRPKPTDPSQSFPPITWPDVCSTHTASPCTKQQCPMFGFKGPYMWVVCKLGDSKWSLLPIDESRKLEVLFSNPNICSAAIHFDGCEYPLNFTRRGTICAYENPELRVERLCDSSQQWNWYMRREDLQTASSKVSTVSKVSACPKIVSKVFRHLKEDFVIMEPSLIENFERRYQRFLSTGQCGSTGYDIRTLTKREERKKLFLCRRPAPNEDIKMELSKAQYVSIPEGWVTKSGFSVHTLEPETSHDFRILSDFVLSRLPKSSGIRIKKFENHNLWKHYCVKRQSMLKHLGKSNLNEALLFHGTHPNNVMKIAEENFDFRLAGQTFGINFGQGTYLTPDVNFALKWADATESGRKFNTVLAALVLCGESCVGMPSYKRPPVKSNGKDLYDSCVDDENKPEQFVIFDHNQMYPMFAIYISK